MIRISFAANAVSLVRPHATPGVPPVSLATYYWGGRGYRHVESFDTPGYQTLSFHTARCGSLYLYAR